MPGGVFPPTDQNSGEEGVSTTANAIVAETPTVRLAGLGSEDTMSEAPGMVFMAPKAATGASDDLSTWPEEEVRTNSAAFITTRTTGVRCRKTIRRPAGRLI